MEIELERVTDNIIMHAFTPMMRVNNVMQLGVVREAQVFCIRCGRLCMVDESFLSRGNFYCDGVASKYASWHNTQDMPTLEAMVARIAEGMTLPSVMPISQQHVDKEQAANLVLMLMDYMRGQMQILEGWVQEVFQRGDDYEGG